uniref:Uncharacterized protein n=1 Tax=Triticum urartu TaxID=4572 RepID=A0A8R7V278_TRIUA
MATTSIHRRRPGDLLCAAPHSSWRRRVHPPRALSSSSQWPPCSPSPMPTLAAPTLVLSHPVGRGGVRLLGKEVLVVVLLLGEEALDLRSPTLDPRPPALDLLRRGSDDLTMWLRDRKATPTTYRRPQHANGCSQPPTHHAPAPT